jgi:hypothetical protein
MGKARRPWTDEDQKLAETAYSSGIKLAAIGRMLDRDPQLVKYHLDPEMAKRKREMTLDYHRRFPEWHAQYQRDNPDKVANYSRRWVEKNPEKAKARWARYSQLRKAKMEADPEYKEQWLCRRRLIARSHYAKNRERMVENRRIWREKNRDRLREYMRRYRETKQARQDGSTEQSPRR